MHVSRMVLLKDGKATIGSSRILLSQSFDFNFVAQPDKKNIQTIKIKYFLTILFAPLRGGLRQNELLSCLEVLVWSRHEAVHIPCSWQVLSRTLL